MNVVSLSGGKYDQCEVGGVEAKVSASNCSFALNAEYTRESGVADGTLDLLGGECSISLSVGELCVLNFAPQEGFGVVEFRTTPAEGEQEQVTTDVTAEQLKYTYEGLFCGKGETANGIFHGRLTLRASDTEDIPIDFTVAST